MKATRRELDFYDISIIPSRHFEYIILSHVAVGVKLDFIFYKCMSSANKSIRAAGLLFRFGVVHHNFHISIHPSGKSDLSVLF